MVESHTTPEREKQGACVSLSISRLNIHYPRHERGFLDVCFNQSVRQGENCCLCSVPYPKLVNSCADMAFYGFSRNEKRISNFSVPHSTDNAANHIQLLMESARMGLAQNNPGVVVGAVSQLDKLCGLSASRR